MDIGLKISELCKRRKISAYDIAKHLNKTPQAVYDIFKRKSIDSNLLLLISNILEVPVTYFFDVSEFPDATSQQLSENKNIQGSNFNSDHSECIRELLHLKEILALKEEMIEMQRTLIKNLQKGVE
jgi:transcriptional regulator with XRE-family HTH domain